MVLTPSRRRFLHIGSAAAFAGIAGCNTLRDSEESSSAARRYAGRVVTPDGQPVSGAQVEALVTSDTSLADTETDDAGAFELTAPTDPVWLRVTHQDYVTETRAVRARDDVELPLTPADGVVSFAFGGDVMFGRRYYEPNDDPSEPQARISPGSRQADHESILQYIAPLFQSADVGSVNLETPLTESAWRHPTKDFTFTSHPVAASVLADNGVDYTSLGNNHTFDALRPGLRDTIDAVDEAGLEHSGAGFSAAEAWNPAVVEQSGASVAFISCTTIAGRQYDIDWSADATGRGPYSVTQDDRSLTFGDGIGSAEATDSRLQQAVTEAQQQADIVVVQIHGGDEYRRQPTAQLDQLVDTATRAGADLVVNHHPHVTGGIEERNGGLVAWTLGNLAFDQELWPTLRSYALVVHATSDEVVRAYTQPLLIDGYVPKPTTGTVARRLSWETAGLSSDAANLLSHGRRLEVGAYADSVSTPRRRSQSVSGDDAIYTRTAGWVEDVTDVTGEVLLGQNRLVSGAFNNNAVDDDQSAGALWRFGTGTDSRTAASRDGAIRLTAYPENSRRSFLSPASRLPVEDRRVDVTCRYRYPHDGGLSLLVAWYNADQGISIERETIDLAGTDDEWTRITESFTPPTEATRINLFLYLEPPTDGDARTVDVDDIRLIEWASPERTGGREFDHVLVQGDGTLNLRGEGSSPAEWDQL